MHNLRPGRIGCMNLNGREKGGGVDMFVAIIIYLVQAVIMGFVALHIS